MARRKQSLRDGGEAPRDERRVFLKGYSQTHNKEQPLSEEPTKSESSEKLKPHSNPTRGTAAANDVQSAKAPTPTTEDNIQEGGEDTKVDAGDDTEEATERSESDIGDHETSEMSDEASIISVLDCVWAKACKPDST